MLRSPFFCFIILLFLFSCKEKKAVETNTESIRKEAHSLRNKGIENYDKQNFNTSFDQFNKSKQLYETLKDSANIGYTLIMMASIQQVNGDYYGSKETVTEALIYVKKKSPYTAEINNRLGIADKELSLYEDAISYYREAANDYKDYIDKLDPLSNIAVVYIQQKKYNNAISLLESILNKKLSKEKAQATDDVILIDNLGYA